MVTDPLVICVDPGHGGKQSYGAMWPPLNLAAKLSGEALEEALATHARSALAVEKDINLNLALALSHAIEGSGWPVICELTRDADEGLGLDARAALAAKHGAALAISLHCDTSTDARVTGLWTYVRPGDKPAMAFARDVMLSAPVAIRKPNHEPTLAKPSPDWTGRAANVLAPYLCPAVLVECGFISHDGDRALLTSEAGQAQIVACLMAAVAGLWRRETRAAA